MAKPNEAGTKNYSPNIPFRKWLDPVIIEDIVEVALKEAKKKVSLENKKILWLAILERLRDVMDDELLYQENI